MASEYAKILKYLEYDLSLAIGRKDSENYKIFGKKFDCFTTNDISYLINSKDQINGIFVAVPPTASLSWIGNLFNQNILIEKPGQLHSSKLRELIEYKNNIFVAYNRKFYKTFLDLKKFVDSQEKKCFIHANIPEKGLPLVSYNEKKYNYYVLSNSCHIFSILRAVFGDLCLKKTFKDIPSFFNDIGEFNTITSEGHLLCVSIHLNEFSNTSISVKGDSNSFLLNPIENSYLINGLDIGFTKVSKQRIYTPKKNLINNEFLVNEFKPGLLAQVLSFIEFCKSGDLHSSLTDIKEATNIIEELEYLYN